MAKPREGLSIICISFFSGHLIPQLLDNISRVIKTKKQIIIVNNAGTSEKIDPGNSDVIVIDSPQNLGYGGGINLGIKHAAYENLLIVNPDIEITTFQWGFPNCTMLYLAGGLQKPKPCGYVFPSIFRDSLGYIIPPFRNHLRKKILCHLAHDTTVDWFSGNLIMTNKRTMEALSGFDESFFLFYEEVDLCKRASKKNIMVFISPLITYFPSQLKASSIDVSTPKIIHELNSFALYHKRYSNCHKTVFTLLRSVFFLYATLLKGLGAVINNRGVHRVRNNYKNRLDQIVRVCRNE